MKSILVLILMPLLLQAGHCNGFSWSRFTQLTSISGQLVQQLLQPDMVSCNPCQYVITLYHSSATVTIALPNEPPFLQKQLAYTDAQDGSYVNLHFISDKYSFEVGYAQWRVVVGLQWEYEITVQGYHIKDKGVYYAYLLPLIGLLYGAVCIAMFPIDLKALRQKIQRMGDKVIGISLVVLIFKMQTIILMEIVVAMVYIAQLQSDFMRVVAYFVWMMGMAAALLYIMIFTLILVKKYKQYKSYHQSLLDSNAHDNNAHRNHNQNQGCYVVMILGSLLVLPILLCFVWKGVLFYVLLSGGMLYQYILGYRKRVYPHLKFIALDLITTGMLMLFTGLMPIFGYALMPISIILVYWVYQVIITVAAYHLIKAKIHGTIQEHEHIQEQAQDYQQKQKQPQKQISQKEYKTTQPSQLSNQQPQNDVTIEMSASNL